MIVSPALKTNPSAVDSVRSAVICIDLDGTLVLTDTLLELVFVLARRRPWVLVRSLAKLYRGRAAFKKFLAENATLDVEHLPYNDKFIDWLRSERDKGRTLILATGADEAVANRVADHLGLFSQVLASNGSVNLTGSRKLGAIRRLTNTFDYAGDSRADLRLFDACKEAILVSSSKTLIATVRRRKALLRVFPTSSGSGWPALIRAMRPHQWVKNFLCLAAMFTSHKLFAPGVPLRSALLLGSFCFCASSAYVLNDLLDLDADRAHRTKKMRPFASGQLSLATGFWLLPALLIIAFLLSARLGAMNFEILLVYLVMTVAYSFWLKRISLIDIFVLSGLYTIRVIAGHTAARVPLSPWLSSFSMFVFISLACAKRSSELYYLRNSNEQSVRGRGYSVIDFEHIQVLGLACGVAACLVLTLYLNSDAVRLLYSTPEILWLIVPIILYWITRIWMLTSRGLMSDDPVLFAAKDRVTQVLALVVAVVAWLATRKWE